MERKKPVNIAVFASGRGSNFEAIVRAARAGRIKNCRICLLLSDNRRAPARQRARRWGIKEICLLRRDFPSVRAYEEALLGILRREKIGLVVLAGFMRIISPYLISCFKNRIINIHPSLLPAFAGKDAIRRSYDYGVKVGGVTVHIVDEKVDHGPIIAQEALSLRPEWSRRRWEEEIHKVEHRLFPQVINYFTTYRIRVGKRKVRVNA